MRTIVTPSFFSAMLTVPVLLWATLLTTLAFPAHAISCTSGNPIDVTLPKGTRWEMCWQQNSQTGVELSAIHVTMPGDSQRRILRRMSVAQIHEAFDNNAEVINHVTRYGLGGRRLQSLTTDDCNISDQLLNNAATRAVACRRVLPRGLIFKFQNNRSVGDLLEVFSISRTASATFVVRWHFHDDGTIVPSIGVTGKLRHYATNAANGWKINNGSRYAVGSTLNFFWRLDFAIGDSATDNVVEQFESRSSLTRLSKAVYKTRIRNEARLTVAPGFKRSWRVRDGSERNADADGDGRGHNISYHLEPITTGHKYTGPGNEPWSRYDLFVTKRNNCELFATDNRRHNGNCGDSAYNYVNGANVNGADVVLWYSISRHQLPRNEDEPTKPIEWNLFYLYPRDWTQDNPLS